MAPGEAAEVDRGREERVEEVVEEAGACEDGRTIGTRELRSHCLEAAAARAGGVLVEENEADGGFASWSQSH